MRMSTSKLSSLSFMSFVIYLHHTALLYSSMYFYTCLRLFSCGYKLLVAKLACSYSLLHALSTCTLKTVSRLKQLTDLQRICIIQPLDVHVPVLFVNKYWRPIPAECQYYEVRSAKLQHTCSGHGYVQ